MMYEKMHIPELTDRLIVKDIMAGCISTHDYHSLITV